MLYKEIGGSNWKNSSGWNKFASDKDYCNWYGITCDDDTSIITLVNLPNNNLIGKIDSNYFKLPGVEELNITNNALKGSINFLLQLTEVKKIDISHNGFSGIIPMNIGKLDRLRSVIFNDNELSSNIPSSISQLSNLETLNFARNLLVEGVPKISSTLQRLKALNVSGNFLTGETDDLKNLKDIGK